MAFLVQHKDREGLGRLLRCWASMKNPSSAHRHPGKELSGAMYKPRTREVETKRILGTVGNPV